LYIYGGIKSVIGESSTEVAKCLALKDGGTVASELLMTSTRILAPAELALRALTKIGVIKV
jgi:hypothetical protein